MNSFDRDLILLSLQTQMTLYKNALRSPDFFDKYSGLATRYRLRILRCEELIKELEN